MLIRKYKPSDRKQVEYIHFETGFLGNSMSRFLSGRKIWNNAIKYYLEKEPESIFVAEDDGKVIGYLLGCLDDSKHNVTVEKILESFSIIFKLPFMSKKDKKFWKSRTGAISKIIIGKSGERKLKHPEKSGHIHINLLPQARGKGVGSKLLNAFIKYAKSKGVKTIHADSFQTKINDNKNFWIKNKFKEHSKADSCFWELQYPKENIFIVCYSRKI
jgi:ribosomal protein S18 acetylase RimI-like enzyme